MFSGCPSICVYVHVCVRLCPGGCILIMAKWAGPSNAENDANTNPNPNLNPNIYAAT